MPEESLTVIGYVRSALRRRADAPKQGFEGGVQALVELEPEFTAGLGGVRPGQDLLLFTWLHKARRDALLSHPRGDATKPLAGVFSLRSPHRPNPIGMHRVRVVALDGSCLTVAPLEAIDGTPVVDIKPVLEAECRPAQPDAPGLPEADTAILREAGERAWARGLVSGFNGNLSLRRGTTMLVTASGCAKGRLTPADIAHVRIADGATLQGGPCSSETPMHLAVYRAVSEAQAVVHLHPRNMLALSLMVSEDRLLALPLYEASAYRRELAFVPALNPGSQELAQAVAAALIERKAVFMHGHGLTCRGRDVFSALHLAEELEGLATIQLHTLR